MRRGGIFLLLSLVAAFLAALVVFSQLRRYEVQRQQAKLPGVEIVVAARDIPFGEKIEPSALRLARWSRESIPVGAFTDPAAVANSYARDGLVAGEPILRGRLLSAEKASGMMPLLIPRGMRAVSVPVDEVSGIAGFVMPRTWVDVLVALSGGSPGDKPFCKIVLQNVEVLAIAQQIGKGKDQPEVVKVVTLLVTPHQAEKLSLASHEGALRLAMRSYDDNAVVATPGSDLPELLGRASALQTQAAPTQRAAVPRLPHGPRPFALEIIRDGKSAEMVSFVGASLGNAPDLAGSPLLRVTRTARDARADGRALPDAGSAAISAAPKDFERPTQAPQVHDAQDREANPRARGNSDSQ